MSRLGKRGCLFHLAAYQYLHCTTKLILYLRTDIDIELHSVYKLHREGRSVLIIHFV